MRRTEKDWLALIKEQAASGLNVAQFARQHGIAPKYFYLRRKALSTIKDRAEKSPFVKLSLPPKRSASDCCLRVGGVELYLSESVSTQWLAQLMKALA